MNIKIGEKIKSLRVSKGVTQDKLAEYLGVTAQAISRWENGSGYPDIELLPALASFFNITTDELLCYDRSEGEQNKLLLNIKTLMTQGRTEEALELGREGLSLYPSNYALIFCVGSILLRKAGPRDADITADEKRALLNEATSMFRRVLSDCKYDGFAGDTIRVGTKNMLTLTLDQLEDNDEALKISRELPMAVMAQEFAVQRHLFGEERIEYSLTAATNLIPMINSFIIMLAHTEYKKAPPIYEYSVEEYLRCISIWDMVYAAAGERGELFKRGIWMYIGLNINLAASYTENGENDKAFAYLKYAAECCAEADRSERIEFNAFQRVSYIEYDPRCKKADDKYIERGSRYTLLHGYIENGVFDALKNHNGWDGIIELLSGK